MPSHALARARGAKSVHLASKNRSHEGRSLAHLKKASSKTLFPVMGSIGCQCFLAVHPATPLVGGLHADKLHGCSSRRSSPLQKGSAGRGGGRKWRGVTTHVSGVVSENFNYVCTATYEKTHTTSRKNISFKEQHTFTPRCFDKFVREGPETFHACKQ